MDKFRITSGLRRRILVVEDELINREILGNILSPVYETAFAENGQEAWQLLHDEGDGFSLVLLDLIMPLMDGFELLKKIKNDDALKSIPVIVMTSEKEAEVQCIRNGAVDFIKKPYDMPEVILARCERTIELYEDKSIIRSVERDSLTGLYSKDMFFEYVKRIDSYNMSPSMDAIVLDIEHFRLINEMFGRKEGDKLLSFTAELIRSEYEGTAAIACRAEGDTFFIYCEHSDVSIDIAMAVQTKLASVSDEKKVKLRIGIYENVDKNIDAETRFDRAKLACDRIRGDYSKSFACYSDELHQRSIYQERLISDIDKGIAREEFQVFFQPKYDISGDVPRMKSAEALIRWFHPELGRVSPGDFIPLFENNGLITRLDNYVWNKVAACIREWKDRYGISIPVSVNVSRVDIYDPSFEDKLMTLLRDNSLSTEDILLEITESAYSENAKKLIEVTTSLRKRGFKIEMDDFGAGYSSLHMLTELPIDVIKMDMKFVQNLEKDEKSVRLIELIMDIARFLQVPVVAEGVENEGQLSRLKALGCTIIQGFYFSKPVPADEFIALCEKRS
ncbi:diguanylate cyclase (GGDEF) domain-containing protein [Lachnospiraceae bacterium JC7]|nr:diguanylate cyclase (GGDEF) domain-containing protein [Lachnospiraceae bacterium JC7]